MTSDGVVLAVILSCVACARVEGEQTAADAGLVDLPTVTAVEPPQGAADPKAAFHVAFSHLFQVKLLIKAPN